MHEAHYEVMETGRFFGDIPSCSGVWGEGATLEECREDLEGALQDWIIVGLRHGLKLPIVAGIDINPLETEEHAQAR